jgi:hypothetical protein
MYRIDTVKSTFWQVLCLMISQIEEQENIQISIFECFECCERNYIFDNYIFDNYIFECFECCERNYIFDNYIFDNYMKLKKFDEKKENMFITLTVFIAASILSYSLVKLIIEQ